MSTSCFVPSRVTTPVVITSVFVCWIEERRVGEGIPPEGVGDPQHPVAELL
jgi:hypothetical protein